MRNLQYDLDIALRNKEENCDCGYKAQNGTTYDRYMSNNSWMTFKEEMSKYYKNHYKHFESGGGGEIEEKRYPPKMACYGSSSRFIYLLLRDNFEVKFEHPIDTNVGGTAYLDAYLCKEDTDVFIEAKCREIYGSKNNSIKKAYEDVYKFISQSIGEEFYTNQGDVKNDPNRFICKFKHQGTPLYHLDIKQLVYHFLAISANHLTKDDAKSKIRFIYLIYNPDEFGNEKLNNIYKETMREITMYDMIKLFNTVFEYQKKHLSISKNTPEFEFVFADQNTCKKYL